MAFIATFETRSNLKEPPLKNLRYLKVTSCSRGGCAKKGVLCFGWEQAWETDLSCLSQVQS